MGYRYIGAKTKILDQVIRRVSALVPKGGRVCDLMSGTGAVCLALRKNDYRVTAVDIMTYSYHHARVALLFTQPPSFRNAKDFIDEHSHLKDKAFFPLTPYEGMVDALNNVPPETGYFWREFSAEGCPKNTQRPRNYFSPENATRIDGIRTWIKRLKTEGRINDLERSLLLHDLIMAANDVANIAGTYGHYLSRLIGRAESPLRLRPSSLVILPDSGSHEVLRGYAEDLASSIECDLCYIDPPYMKRQYAANYHILETLAREDEPEAIGVSGLRPWRDQYSNFCTKTKIRDSFARVFRDMKCEDFLISYSEDGLLRLEQLRSLLSEFGQIEVSEFKSKRFKSNETKLSPKLTEYIVRLRLSK